MEKSFLVSYKNGNGAGAGMREENGAKGEDIGGHSVGF